MIVAFSLQAICLFLVVAVGQLSGRAGSRSRWCWSTSPGARSTRCSRPRPATTSARATPRRTTRVLYTAKGVGVDHRRLGRRAALRAVRQLGGGLLRQRGDGARGRGASPSGCARAGRAGTRSVRQRAGAREVELLDAHGARRSTCTRSPTSCSGARRRGAPMSRRRRRATARSISTPPTPWSASCRGGGGQPAARPSGRKVGYANKAVWRALKLDTLVWADMYDDTVRHAPRNDATLSRRAARRAEDRARDRLPA